MAPCHRSRTGCPLLLFAPIGTGFWDKQGGRPADDFRPPAARPILRCALLGERGDHIVDKPVGLRANHVAADLVDVEQSDCAADVLRAFGERAPYGHALIGWVENSHGTSSILRLVGIEPKTPLAHPPNIAENLPAGPPATTIWIFFVLWNFGTSLPSSTSLRSRFLTRSEYASYPPESSFGINSRNGRAVISWIRRRTSSLVQRSCQSVSICSGHTTSKTLP